MSTATEWTTVARERVPLLRRWRTTVAYWAREGDGEVFVREQRHRFLPWRGRRQAIRYDDREVTA